MFLGANKGFPGGPDGKESACNVGDTGLIPWVGKILSRMEWLPTPVFLENSMDRAAWQTTYSPLGHKSSDTTE